MSQLSGEQIAQVAYAAGFRGEDLVNMVAIAKRESGWKSDAHRTDRDPSAGSGDRGLWQINYIHDDNLRAAGIINSWTDLLDPAVNARAAKWVHEQAGLYAWGVGANGWEANGDPFYGTNVNEARQKVQSASERGLLGQQLDYSTLGGAGSNTPGAVSSSASFAEGAPSSVQLPTDARVLEVQGGQTWVAFDVGQGLTIVYNIRGSNSDWQNYQSTVVSKDQFDAMAPINGGDVEELLFTKSTFGTFKGFWDSLLAQVMGPNNPARNDPEVLRVIADFAARPDMSTAELQNKLQATQWYQNSTRAELEWNGLSDAEKEKRLGEAAANARDTWFQYTGQLVDENDPRIANYVEELASGRLGFGAFSAMVRDQALGIVESPYARQVRGEQEQQRQRGVDIENTAQNIRETLQRWGLSWTNDEVMRWAGRIVSKEASDDDLMTSIQRSAAVLYPWKDPEQETLQAAQPWLQTYERVMERTGSLETSAVQKALTSGQPVWEFEQEMKKSDEWLTTKNAASEMTSMVSEMGRKLGFV